MSMVMLDWENFIFYYSKTGRFLNDFQTENTGINDNYFRILRRDDGANSEKIQYKCGDLSARRYGLVLMKADGGKMRNGG
jgi:hypothetical protein